MKEIFVNIDRCLGCLSCEIACRVEHSLTKNIFTSIFELRLPKKEYLFNLTKIKIFLFNVEIVKILLVLKYVQQVQCTKTKEVLLYVMKKSA